MVCVTDALHGALIDGGEALAGGPLLDGGAVDAVTGAPHCARSSVAAPWGTRGGNPSRLGQPQVGVGSQELGPPPRIAFQSSVTGVTSFSPRPQIMCLVNEERFLLLLLQF